LFALKGFNQTKISDIVKEAGVAQGTFYWYFKNKEEIILELIHKGQEKLLKVIEQGYRKEAGTVEDMIGSSTRLMSDLFVFAAENRSLMILLFIKGYGTGLSIQAAVSETFLAMEEAFGKNIKRAVELGMLEDTIELSLRATMLTSLVTGTISRWLFGPMRELDYKPEIPPETIAEKVVAFEFNGLIGRNHFE
jgi:AcrR family transcriptional regulator